MSGKEVIEERARVVMNEALAAIVEEREALVIVDSPPGAGKTWFCERVIALAIGGASMRVCYVAPKVDQGADMARRLLESGARFGIDVLVGHGRSLPPDLAGRVVWTDDASGVGGAGRVVITNPHKLAFNRDRLMGGFDLMLIDEAYQVAARDFLPIAGLAPCTTMVGDPGQLAPTITIDTNEFESDGARVHWAAPREILRLHPETRVFQLPATRRLVQDTVRIVQPSFYPALPFVSAASDRERRIAFAAGGIRDPLDDALNMLESGCSLIGLVLPGEPPATDERDQDVENLIARIAQRMLERGIGWVGHKSLSGSDIGVIDAHVLSGNATKAVLQSRGMNTVRVATPELWQGQQAPVIIAKHPLSIGRAAPSPFALDPGRFCVMLSRHLLACIVVGRESVHEGLARYMHDSRPTPIGSADAAWHGYKAHSHVWSTLHDEQRIIRIAA